MIPDLSALKKNDFEKSGIKGVQVHHKDGVPTLDPRANGWSVEDGHLYLWKFGDDNGSTKAIAMLATYAAGSWTGVNLASEL